MKLMNLEFAYAFLKMVFKGSAKWKFLVLMLGFLSIMIINYSNHIQKYQNVREEKRKILEEDAFKIFFVYSTLSHKDFQRLIFDIKSGKHIGFKPVYVTSSFIFQKNLFIDLLPEDQVQAPLAVLYNLFKINPHINQFLISENDISGEYITLRPMYINYNGEGLSTKKQQNRLKKVKKEYIEEYFADEIANIYFKDSENKFNAFNEHREKLLNQMIRIERKEKGVNPYVSMVELIIPKNILNILVNLSQMTSTTSIRNAITYTNPDSSITIKKNLMLVLNKEKNKHAEKLAYDYFLPRFVPVYQDNFIAIEKHWLYESLRPNESFINYLKNLHSSGYYLFSYEKLNILSSMINRINSDIKFMQIYFILVDILLGNIFAFTISFFSFIYLKREIAFLLFHKNKTRLILWFFYLFPLFLMICIKFGMYYKAVFIGKFDIFLFRTITISTIVVMFTFWIMNRLCFAEFQTNKLRLYSIFKS